MSDRTAEVLSNVSPEAILYHTHELSRTKRKITEANSAHRLAVKRAKSDNVPTEAILESIAWAALDPEVRRQKIIDRIKVEAARYPENGEAITDLVSQLDVRVSEKMRYTDTLFDAEQRGYQAGKFGVPVEDNPYAIGSEMAQRWREFWSEGQAANAAQLGENARAADTSRRPASTRQQPAADLPLGEEAAPRKRGRRAAANGAATQHPAAEPPAEAATEIH